MGLIVKASYWRWPGRDMAGIAYVAFDTSTHGYGLNTHIHFAKNMQSISVFTSKDDLVREYVV